MGCYDIINYLYHMIILVSLALVPRNINRAIKNKEVKTEENNKIIKKGKLAHCTHIVPAWTLSGIPTL